MAQDDRVCNSCGGALNEDSKFCPACGTNVETPSDVDCPSCGAKNAPESKYCDKCGSLLQEQTQEPSESHSQQPSETTELEPSSQACRVCGNTLNPAEPNSLDEELCVPCYEESVNADTEKVTDYQRFDSLREEQRLVDEWKDEPLPAKVGFSLLLEMFEEGAVWVKNNHSGLFKRLTWLLMQFAFMFILLLILDHAPFISNLGSGIKIALFVVLTTLFFMFTTDESRGFVINLVKFAGALGLLIFCVAGLALSILVIILAVEGLENTPFFKIFIR